MAATPAAKLRSLNSKEAVVLDADAVADAASRTLTDRAFVAYGGVLSCLPHNVHESATFR
ncbi:MAG TPA: hypothetical protein VGG82_10300 [Casimicrobiaceae bacterium]